ncbi:hypothetical protein [Streptomyces sp. V1I1]|uniref:hypothetical protein n=1 Tax=Streptomyces sp. V1I1 TaxID=3042272 RepID=UPI0027817F37|nr:hypothetical protein [Streptomyces sp. V1I1]MDQ0943259.1 uncharacterized protein YceH (UPF0502 family) [Streptomyces sp. V1I1]
MDAATVTAIGVLGSALVAGLAAMYGSRIAGRAQQEGHVITGYDSLAAKLVAERDKAERDQATAEAKVTALELEVARLRLLVTTLGGTP